jgi:penicillin amidase
VRRLLRWLGWTFVGLIGLALIATAGGYWWLRQSLPLVDGEIRLAGLEAPVVVVRDEWAVPHIEADSWLDATFAQGFVHAQDRLWQMEFQRRVGAGRLAEIVGAPALSADRFLRALGLYRLAEASLAHLEPATVAWLEAYADGVNAFLETRTGPLPPEFQILRHHDIEPWRPADSLVWLRMMALDLGSNWRDELLRARLAKRLSADQIADLWPDYPAAVPTTLVELARRLEVAALIEALPPAAAALAGSNAWVMAGTRTRSGAALLANDPHLGLQAPGIWYLNHLRSPELEAIGASLPGVPGITLGHNDKIAWGLTTTGADTQDLFVERLDSDDPGRYLTPDGTAPFQIREEIIHVAGAEPVTLRVRETRHGPVLSDLVPISREVLGPDQVLALAWPALAEDDVTIQALLGITRAEDWPRFVEALRDVGAPIQNVVYADVEGTIGFLTPGRIPIRRAGDGRWPVPGWSGSHDWIGWVPFDELPRARDPADGRFFNANNRIVPESYPHLITADWQATYRAQRLEALLSGDDHDLATFATIQSDELSLLAEQFLPHLLAVEATDPATIDALGRLRGWDRTMRVDAAEPLIFAAWYRELSRLVYADELGEIFRAYWNIRPRFMALVLTERQIWCDDVDTPEIEDCAALAARALTLALADLRARFGDDPDGWSWGGAHPALMDHAVFSDVPVLGRLFDVLVAQGGDSATVDVGHYLVSDDAHPFRSRHAATYRGLYDLGDLGRSRFIAATGQSGHPLSSHYRDLTDLWAGGETIAMTRDPATYGATAIGRLMLEPAP